MPTYIDLTNLSPATITALSSTAPTITQVQITTSGYVVKDDTAVSTSGGYIKITGTNFTAGTQVVIGSVTATSVTFVNSTTLNVQVPAQAAGTYIVYVTVSNGGVAILVNGLTYSGDPTWVTGSTLTGGQVDSAISIQFSATGDAPVTYALQAGSTLPPGLSLSSGGLLSGTVTGITSETTYNFTVEAIDGQAQESPRAFSITIAAGDANFEYVTTLLSASNPSSTFVSDASTNNFAVSVIGDTRPNNFGPYTPGYYSNYFTSTNALTVPDNAAWNLDTDITVEAFCYLESYNTSDQYYIVSQVATGQRAWGFSLANGKLQVYYTTNGSTDAFIYSNSFTVTAGQWYHFAFTRTGAGVYTFYVNGVATGSTTDAASIFASNQPLTIGQFGNFGISTLGWKGFISNLRYVRGTIVYTGNFTPSTTPLTTITNTQLLTCQSNRFIDNSTNNFTVTVSGSVSISGFDPFIPLSAYSTYGSGYFDGTGDYLSLASNTAFAAPADFTVEFWAYTSSLASNPVFYLINATNGLIVYVTGSKVVIRSYGVADLLTSNINMPLNQWVHIAASRSGTTMSLWINGSRTDGGTVTNSTSFAQGELRIGNNETVAQGVTGYISNVRFVKGTAVYNPTQTTITVPTAPLTAVANTQLLTLQNNQPNNNNMFLDSSASNFLITRNGNTTQGSFTPYGGGWSNYFDGTGDYLTMPYSASTVQWWDTDYTIEMWIFNRVNAQSATNSLPLQVAYGLPTSADTYWSFGTNSSGNLYFYYYNGAGVTNAVSTSTVALNTWTHVAMVYTNSNSTLKGYINGVQAFSVSKSGTPQGPSGSTLNLGSVQNTGYNGYISNLRIVRGTAVYTAAFTPPTAPLTPIANTSLLTCADNRFIDDSGNNFTITRNGDVSVQRFNPFNPVLTTPTSYSGYFDGTGDYLTAPNNAATTLNADFTIEFWVYRSASGNNFFFTLGDSFTSTGIEVYIGSTGSALIVYSNGANRISSATLPAVGTWSHVAVVRAGTTVTLYLNGASLGTWTSSATFSGTTYIGAEFFNGSVTGVCTGYISNVRLVKGTAVYTAAFTPPTAPLTAVSGTSLLTCQNATFVDNSTNNFAITVFGNSQPTQFNPFGWTSTTGSNATYSVANYGGSMYFDGTGDYLVSVLSPVLNLTNGNWTIEVWLYPTSLAAQSAFFGTFNGNSRGLSLMVNTNGTVQSDNNGDGASVGTSSGSSVVRINQWNHVVVTRSDNTISYYINGVASGSSATGTYYDQTTQNFYIGSTLNPAKFWTGYISNLRYIRGTVLYTASFAPPVAPLQPIQNTLILANGTSAAIYDSAMMATYETLGNASTTGVIKKYGNSSMSFDGTGDYLVSPFSVNNNLGTGSFTFEAWLYPSSIAGIRGFYALSGGPGGVPKFVMHLNAGTPSIHYNGLTGGSDIYTTATSAITANTWTHLAFVRNGSTWTWYINGVASGTGSNSTNITFTTQPLYVGYGGESYFTEFNGYIDDLRVTNGVARYTANFTPPTSPVIQF